MLLTIDRLQVKVQPIREEIERLKVEVRQSESEEAAQKTFNEQAETLIKLRAAITERKAAKFERDTQDYLQRRVYTWREERNRQRWGRRNPNIGLQAPEGEVYLTESRYRHPRGYPKRAQGGYRRSYPQQYPPQRYPSQQYSSDYSEQTSSEELLDSSADRGAAQCVSFPFLGQSQAGQDVGPARENSTRGKGHRKNPRAPLQREDYPRRTQSYKRY
ncbi:uncharacterized protein LOC121401368 [Xenopus laevis]|uniref:Uncharacterized protein LOC121401368 n=1 Tax=Xenopus laevis TaxID=8355 RepID=A0A8J1MJB7_XENLA|nr:uncharacterized protein LOC121401368 [Xenopus laevis]